jgi:hypothetical protein
MTEQKNKRQEQSELECGQEFYRIADGEFGVCRLMAMVTQKPNAAAERHQRHDPKGSESDTRSLG